MMKTYSPKASDIERQWHLIDANGVILGKVATQAANWLMGKHKPMFARHLDVGDYVVIINAEKVSVTGGKETKKMYYRHSNYPGGFKVTSLGAMLETHPTRIIEHAVKGMLPQNRLNDRMMKRLRIYVGEKHPHQSQITAAAATATEENKN